jgi:hypothetical protein
MVCLQARWGVSEDAVPGARVQGEELERRLERIMHHYAGLFHEDAPDEELGAPLSATTPPRGCGTS